MELKRNCNGILKDLDRIRVGQDLNYNVKFILGSSGIK